MRCLGGHHGCQRWGRPSRPRAPAGRPALLPRAAAAGGHGHGLASGAPVGRQHSPFSQVQLRRATWASQVKPGFIMCGDLNAPPFLPSSSYSTLIADGRWRDLWHERGSLCCQATYPSACGTTACGIRIDHILALQADRAARLLCDEIRILGDPTDADLSDHFAVVADIAVKP
mmetsp:Transcript_99113/g.289196  ORF Transcript_99113/g.289196 Transcript_99113/m.289196 type:complete len:173 (+) Transcript_99113:508-1026(+)